MLQMDKDVDISAGKGLIADEAAARNIFGRGFVTGRRGKSNAKHRRATRGSLGARGWVSWMGAADVVPIAQVPSKARSTSYGK
jgi:hypothetical protein